MNNSSFEKWLKDVKNYLMENNKELYEIHSINQFLNNNTEIDNYEYIKNHFEYWFKEKYSFDDVAYNIEYAKKAVDDLFHYPWKVDFIGCEDGKIKFKIYSDEYDLNYDLYNVRLNMILSYNEEDNYEEMYKNFNIEFYYRNTEFTGKPLTSLVSIGDISLYKYIELTFRLSLSNYLFYKNGEIWYDNWDGVLDKEDLVDFKGINFLMCYHRYNFMED